jgi:hypothetical protein
MGISSRACKNTLQANDIRQNPSAKYNDLIVTKFPPKNMFLREIAPEL